MTTKTVYLKDYQAPAFKVASIQLCFELYDDHTVVHNLMHLTRQQQGALVLNGEQIELISLHLDEKPLSADEFHLDDHQLSLDPEAETFKLAIVTRIYPQKNTELSGLYVSNQLFCTQCEAEGFRRITYFPDRPDVLSVFSTKIIADKNRYPVLLSNGNLQDSGLMDNGRHWVEWHDPFPKPCYLFALVAGDLACVEDEFITALHTKVALRLYVEPGHEDLCAHALSSLKQAMRWDEERYGRVYDLSVLMIVAVSDFNMGAMENKGLNIFNSKYILARPDTATDEDYMHIESVVGHEYFHNWTGNRVTCRDWFQLSLKEGLTVFRDQEFSRDMNSRDVNRIIDVKYLRAHQFPEDSGTMVHPVRPESYQEISNFYTATIYSKGAELIRMQYTLLGQEAFRLGMDLYFERHDGKAVTIDDFVTAMSDASRINLTQFKRWYSQAGTPVVQVKSSYNADRLSLTFKQSSPVNAVTPHPQPLHIPVKLALFSLDGKKLDQWPSLIELQEEETTIEIKGLSEKPLISLFREFSAPIKLETDFGVDNQIGLLRHETDGFAKWDAAEGLMRDQIIRGYQGLNTDASTIFEVLRELLTDQDIDPALRAELLTPPNFDDLASDIHELEVDRLEDHRLDFAVQLGRNLFAEAEKIFHQDLQAHHSTKPGSLFAWRKLRMSCLDLMLYGNESATLDLCRQLLNAKTMTEQLSGLTGLVHSANEAARTEAAAIFYNKWKHEELVLDKWFRVQATADHPKVLEDIKSLLTHPAFQIKNPNKVYALLGGFINANPRQFHAPSGQGYEFLAEQLIRLDAINPQISARLAGPFTRWHHYDKNRQALMKKALVHLNSQPLSKDLKEIVSKSLIKI